MPSQFETDFAGNAAPDLYGVFGLASVYTAPDGTIFPGLTVRVHRNDAHQVDRPNSRQPGELQTGEIIVQQSALTKPEKGGRFVVEGVEVWTVADTPKLANGQFYCVCQRTGVECAMGRRAKE